MTPLAARLFRYGTDENRQMLSQAQFFEVTALRDMASEMVEADIAAGCAEFSDFARLPAPITVIEYAVNLPHVRERVMLCCTEENDSVLRYLRFAANDKSVRLVCSGGFRRGSSDHLKGEFYEHADTYDGPTVMAADDPRVRMIAATNSGLEKLLCIINQPGLVERTVQSTDKRVIREAKEAKLQAPLLWHRCAILPGSQSGGTTLSASPPDSTVMPLHYVRRHFKPSINRWVDGFWRGDIALGLHLKWYSPQPPRRAAP